MALYGATLLIDCTLTSVIDCGGAVWSGVPLATQVEVLVRKWHAYHRPVDPPAPELILSYW